MFISVSPNRGTLILLNKCVLSKGMTGSFLIIESFTQNMYLKALDYKSACKEAEILMWETH